MTSSSAAPLSWTWAAFRPSWSRPDAAAVASNGRKLLLATVLEELGFSVQRLAARVRYPTQQILPRTHMLLLVNIDGANWLADVGFGAEGLLMPVPFASGHVARQFAWTYRIVEEAGQWVLQSRRGQAWTDLYAFTPEPQQPVDYEMANHYVATHPNSRFVQTLTARRLTPETRHLLRNRQLTVDGGHATTTRMLDDDGELLAVLAETFGLNFPPKTRFHYRDTML